MLRSLTRSVNLISKVNPKLYTTLSRPAFASNASFIRNFSSDNKNEKLSQEELEKMKAAEEFIKANQQKGVIQAVVEEAENPENETAREKVSRVSGATFRLVLYLLGLVCAGYTIKSLLPTRLSGKGLFDEVFSLLQYNDEVTNICGTHVKGYGRDFGGHSEGRRNLVDELIYTTPDGRKHCRIRFHMEGAIGKIRVWAEVAEDDSPGNFTYIIFQDMRTGRVLTYVDDRTSAWTPQPYAPPSDPGMPGMPGLAK